VERMNRTLLDECFRVKGRTERYLTPAEIQRDLDAYLEDYNLRCTHQGYRVQGRTAAQALREALGVEELPPFVLPGRPGVGELPCSYKLEEVFKLMTIRPSAAGDHQATRGRFFRSAACSSGRPRVRWAP
jgi:hypothetical protein